MIGVRAVWQWAREEKRAVWFEYSALALALLLPLLLPGYILTLDLVFTPNFQWPSELTNTYPLDVLLRLLYWIVPGDIIQKVILFLILLLSGVGMHQLVRYIKMNKEISSSTWRLSAYFAGVFYMINPFTYSRFMAGQWMVLAGYALLPFFFLALLKLISRPTWQAAVKVAFLALGIVTVSLHHVGMVLFLGVSVVTIGMIKCRSARLLGYAGLSALIVVTLTCYWWVPALIGQGSIGQAVIDFNQTDSTAFATNTHGSLGVLGNVVRLQGFWAESWQLFALPQSFMPMWGLVFLMLWIVVIIGVMKGWRRHRTLVALAVGCIVAGIVFAVTPIVSWIPLFAGYREPHKFVNLVVFGYAILGAFGVAYVAHWASKRFGSVGEQAAIILCLLLPLAITPTMLWGFAGQLSLRQYPPEWYDMNQRLQGKTLFLPWHQYMKYSFSGRIIANPAEKFFTASIVASNDPEFKGVSPTVPSEEKAAIAAALAYPVHLPDVLAKYNIRHILLAKEDDYRKYEYLDNSKKFRLVRQNDRLKLYTVEGVWQ